MSNSRPADPNQQLQAAVEILEQLAADGGQAWAPDGIRSLVSAATRLYAQAVEQAGQELPPVDAGMPTTEALTLSCALLRSQNLTPFDMALWFSRQGQGAA